MLQRFQGLLSRACLTVRGDLNRVGAYERGLLHPFLDYERQSPWLRQIDDPLDGQGNVLISGRPGLGQDINWDYIREHAVTTG